MKRLTLVAIAVVSLAAFAVADQINFNLTFGGPASLVANPSGLFAGPAPLTDITDATTLTTVPFSGNLVSANAGPPTLPIVPIGTSIFVFFTAGGTVLVEDSSSNPLLIGTMRDSATLIQNIPPAPATGSLNGTFDVSFVSPTVLALFGQTSYSPIGSIALTDGTATFDPVTSTITAVIGGGAVTIETSVPEPASLGLVGLGLLTVGATLRRGKRTHSAHR